MKVAAEQVLCVNREDIFPDGAWHGFITDDLERPQKVIRDSHFFKPRAEVIRSSTASSASGRRRSSMTGASRRDCLDS